MTPEEVRRVADETRQNLERWFEPSPELLDTEWVKAGDLYGGIPLTNDESRRVASRLVLFFQGNEIPAQRIDIDKTPPSYTEWLPHAHYLAKGVKDMEEKTDKINRHMSAIKMCLIADKLAPYVTKNQWIAHAYHVTERLLEFVHEPERWAEANRYLTAAQMSLLAGGLATIRELREINKQGTAFILLDKKKLDS